MKYITACLIFSAVCHTHAQENDTVKVKVLKEVTIKGSPSKNLENDISLPISVADKLFLQENFKGNLMQALEHKAGVQSMDIGAGFAKPVIRGMGFNRVAVVETGIKQEGQQWGVDHGLEIDAFKVGQVTVLKGPSSLLFGSDAMGGVLDIIPEPAPLENQCYGDVTFFGKSVNETVAGSIMLGVKHNAWHIRMRLSEQHYGDLRIPADTVTYLTQRLPIHKRRLKNTAGMERSMSLISNYNKGRYSANVTLDNNFQKAGFFAGAHGIPDASSISDDMDSRNISLPLSSVNHLKIATEHRIALNNISLKWNGGLQYNRRKEMSLFHTHYGNQTAPTDNPDLELDFSLITLNSSLKAEWRTNEKWKHTTGHDLQYQSNKIAGYSFLLPEFKRITTGILYTVSFKYDDNITLNGGIRADYGNIKASEYLDSHLEEYLNDHKYAQEVINAYKWRSYPVNRDFMDFSGSLGLIWQAAENHLIKVNTGRSFRLPSANELASNGVHHGAFRHEQGDPSLVSENGWQTDIAYYLEHDAITLSVSPFFSWFDNYIYLKPTGEWSILPHAGQVYRYCNTDAVFAGSETELGVEFLRKVTYRVSGEYVYAHNKSERTPMSFSPPAVMRNRIIYRLGNISLNIELQSIATQYRVSKNEDITKGSNLIHIGANVNAKQFYIALSVYNLLDTKYYNHLSFYRKTEIPEPGRNIQILVKIPFKSRL
ncbi:MAG: TonB-dependent receptor [Dysgonamonadaceae bacterium]|nr:TonB-dependent receptor [Dysgonamonadaceae bacterium]